MPDEQQNTKPVAIGKTSATERDANSSDKFNFWLAPNLILNPFDIVQVEHMGEALVAGLIRSGHWTPSQITVCDIRPDQLAQLQLRYKVKASADNRWAARESDIVLLAVKPQHMPHVLKEIGPVIRTSCIPPVTWAA